MYGGGMYGSPYRRSGMGTGMAVGGGLLGGAWCWCAVPWWMMLADHSLSQVCSSVTCSSRRTYKSARSLFRKLS